MRTIEVIANPYIALDKDGIPQGVVGAGMPGIFIGAQVDLVASKKSGKIRFYFPETVHRNEKGERLAPTLARKVVFTTEIVTAVQAGELLVTNVADAKTCGLTEKEFLPADKALEKEAAKALAYYQSVKGKDAKLGDIPRKAMEEPEAPTANAEKPFVQLTDNVRLAKKEG